MPKFSFTDPAPERLFDQLVENTLAAEQAGFDLVTLMDHYYQIRGVGPEEDPMLEAYVTLGALAARTSRVKLATMVSGVTYHNPAVLAKQVTTLDVISGGRAVLGLGAAWNEDEHRGYGIDFPRSASGSIAPRRRWRSATACSTEERPSYEGRYYRIDRALNNPTTIQPGGPKIMVGGSGERRTLRLLARFGDIGNWFGTLDELTHKRDVFLTHCEVVGRNPADVLLTVMAPVALVHDQAEADRVLDLLPPERRAQVTAVTPKDAVNVLRPYMEAGFHGFVLRNPSMITPDHIALAGDLIGLTRE